MKAYTVISLTQDQGLAEVNSVAMDTHFGLQESRVGKKKKSFHAVLLGRQQALVLLGFLLLYLAYRTH